MPPEPFQEKELPSPSPIPHPLLDSPSASHITYISSSSPYPSNTKSAPQGNARLPPVLISSNPNKAFTDLKGKAPCLSVTPLNSPASSPTNSFECDLDIILKRESINILPLTIHKPQMSPSPSINPTSA